MDNQAVAEEVVQMWDYVEQAWKKTHDGEILSSEHIALHAEAMDWLISRTISAEKKGITPHSPAKEDKTKCQQCGRDFTEKEMKFLDDQPDKKRICYHCTKGL